jgi:Spy/CpxP family protein refolding chaperone
MSRPLVWKLLLALSVGVNAALGAFLVLRDGGAQAAATAGKDDELPNLLATLGLDPVQQAAIDRVRVDYESAREARRAALRAARGELFGLIERSPDGHTALEEQLARVGAEQVALRRLAVDQILGIAALLRPDQRARLLDGLRDRFVEGPYYRPGEAPACACPGTTTSGGGAEGQAP